MKICIINNCFEQFHAKDYCHKHYTRFRVYGDPLYSKYNRDHGGICSIKNCDKKYKSNGYCKDHHYKIFKDEILDRNKKYYEIHPEIRLKSEKKSLSKLGKIFNLTSMSYKWALISWSKIIRNRDKQCMNCGSKEKLNANHILEKRYYPELSLNINNGITLCRKCHGKLHGYEIYNNINIPPS